MKLKYIPIVILLSVPSKLTNALTSDKDQPINIQADKAVVDEKKGVSTYTGNVLIDQGSLKITADQVEVYTVNNEVTRIVATAFESSESPAHYQQTPDDADLIEASAREIIYFVDEERLQMSGKALLKQAEDRSFSGETIQYYVEQGLVNADGGEGRTTTTIKQKQR